MGISLDGLASGLDTTALISQLMQVEAVPQTLLKNKSYNVQSMVTALQGLNGKVASLATQAAAVAKPGALELYTAASSSDKVVVTSTPAAKAGSLDFTVTKLAQTQVTVSDPVAAWPYTTMTITSGGKAVTVSPLTSSLDDVVTAVNAAGAGVTASKVSVGNGQYSLQFTAKSSGKDGEFTISDPGTVFKNAKAAQDAELELWANSPAAQTITSSTNTFAEVLPGVSLTAKDITPLATLTVARDDAGISRLASDLVAGVNGIFSLIASKSTVTTGSGTSGSTATAGIFTGVSTVRDVNQGILSAASLPVGTPPSSPSEIGISITKTGTMEFDNTKFAAALAADPAGLGAKVQEIASRVAAAATQASDKYVGTLTTKITGQQSEVKDLGNQIAGWDSRLAARQAILKSTYSGLEVALGNMKAQQSWLTSQLAGISTGSSSA